MTSHQCWGKDLLRPTHWPLSSGNSVPDVDCLLCGKGALLIHNQFLIHSISSALPTPLGTELCIHFFHLFTCLLQSSSTSIWFINHSSQSCRPSCLPREGSIQSHRLLMKMLNSAGLNNNLWATLKGTGLLLHFRMLITTLSLAFQPLSYLQSTSLCLYPESISSAHQRSYKTVSKASWKVKVRKRTSFSSK